MLCRSSRHTAAGPARTDDARSTNSCALPTELQRHGCGGAARRRHNMGNKEEEGK